ncbi:MAG: hypothetical protein H5U01_09055, partial [Clostridia bacterium]|nr:hypothetical protein [Clostridia bacterium]
MCEDVGWRLRQKGLLARTVAVKIRYADYTTVTRSATLPRPVFSDAAIWQAAKDLYLTPRWARAVAPGRRAGNEFGRHGLAPALPAGGFPAGDARGEARR